MYRPMPMLALLPLLLAACARVARADLYAPGDDVVALTGANFDARVLRSPLPWVVEFYAPWCGHCKNLAPHFRRAASNLRGILPVGAVNCDEDANKPLCGRFGVRGFPTIKLFPADRTGDKKFAVDFNGERTAKAIVDAALDRLVDTHVRRIGSAKPRVTLDAFWSEKNETLPKAVLFTDKSKTAAVIKSLSLEFKDRLLIGECRHTEKAVVKSLGVSSFPTLIVFPVARAGESDTSAVTYDGPLKPIELKKFLEEYALPDNDATSSKSSGKTKQKAKEEKKKPVAPFDPNVPELLTQADLARACIEPSEEGLSNLCLIAFLPPLEKEYPESVKQRNESIELLSSLKKYFYDIVNGKAKNRGSKDEDDDDDEINKSSNGQSIPTYHISFADGTTKHAAKIISKFGLSSDLPSVLIFSPKKKISVRYIGAWDLTDLRRFMENITKTRVDARPFDFEIDFPKDSGNKKAEECAGDADAGLCTAPPLDATVGNAVKSESANHDEL